MSNFDFKSNQNYMEFKMNQKNKPIFLITKEKFSFINFDEREKNPENKSLFSNDTLATERDQFDRETNNSFPNINKNFFNDFHLSKNYNVNVKSFLFNFSKN